MDLKKEKIEVNNRLREKKLEELRDHLDEQQCRLQQLEEAYEVFYPESGKKLTRRQFHALYRATRVGNPCAGIFVATSTVSIFLALIIGGICYSDPVLILEILFCSFPIVGCFFLWVEKESTEGALRLPETQNEILDKIGDQRNQINQIKNDIEKLETNQADSEIMNTEYL